jgi:hypothetical protein
VTSDLQWHVNVEITPANATVFRMDGRPMAPLSRTLWVSGQLSLRDGGGLHLLSRTDRRLGDHPLVLRVPARLSASDGVAEGSSRLCSSEIQLWRRGTRVRLLMSKAPARDMLAAVRALER